jgi:hypothetical protein
MSMESITGIINDVAVSIIAAIGTIYAAWWIYQRKEIDRKRDVCRILLSEIRHLTPLS